MNRALTTWMARPSGWAMAVMAGLCALAFWRSLTLPFISDDYLQIHLARSFGPVSGWGELAQDALYRCRATSLVLTYWTERLFGLQPWAFSATSLLLHILNTWMVYGLGAWRVVGWRVSTVAAFFFAVYQGHQEAVVWYAALPELLVFLFAVASFLFWLRWMQLRGWWWYAASLASFGMALLSKESAAVLGGLLVIALVVEGKKGVREWMALMPYAALSGLYFGMAYAARAGHLHFNDGTFSLRAPFWMVEARSIVRMLWVWGLVSLIALVWCRARRWTPLTLVAVAWMVVTLLPYSFLTYMPFVPSRHTYFASVGLSLVVAVGFFTVQRRFAMRPAVVMGLAAVVLGYQCLYLWTRKHDQYVERAAPTELLVKHARLAEGKLKVNCFPYDFNVATLAVSMVVGQDVELERVSDGGLDLCGRR